MEERQAVRQLKTDIAMAALALVSIGIGVYEIGCPRSTPEMTGLDWVDIGIVVVFNLEFLVAARRAGGFWPVVRERWWELPSLIPITGGMIASLDGIALLRGVRILRIVRIVRILRVISVALRFRRVIHFVARVYRRSQATAILAAAAAIVLLGAVTAFAAESRCNARLADFQENIWWALNMFTNVAYVDFQPVTGMGRLVAGILQVFGIAFIGVFAGSMANAIIRESPPSDPKDHPKDNPPAE